jgi:hypothetical protein
MNPKARKLLTAGVITAIAALGWFALRNSKSEVPAPPGEKLARVYCQSCHLFPEPGLLDKASWTNGALPDMAKWMGLTPADIERSPDGQVVEDSNVFPPSPLISREDWGQIVRFYAENAPEKLLQPARAKITPETPRFRVKPFPYQRRVPMTLMVQIDPSQRRLYVGDAMTHSLEALDAAGNRIFGVQFDSGPVSLRTAGDHLDVTLIGRAFPSDLQKGKLLRLRPGSGQMEMGKLIGDLRRPAHTSTADLNGDGQTDYVISQFGNRKGRLSWFEGRPAGEFVEHVLIDRAGIIRTEVHDLNKDKRPDIIALTGQAWEGIYLFTNEGAGFRQTALVEQHPAFGYSYFEMVDFDQDGDLDLLTTNGDNGESSAPPKPYHGVRIYLNDGANHFVERWFYPIHGAYGARVKDFDGDGDFDIAVISYFPDYPNSPEESFVYLENRGNWQFAASSIPEHAAGRWMTMDAGDLDGDGDEDIVLGSLVLGPTSVPIPREIQERWKNNAPAILLLENTAK